MDITPTTTATAAPAAGRSAPTTISSDFETFLRMLTAQLQNQDPLNPLDSTDFAVQLATFAGVEQQVRSNDLLAGLAEQMALVGVTQLAGWVGMEARVAAAFRYDDAPVTLYGSPSSGADRADLVIRNAAGTEVYRGAMALSAESAAWAGTDSAGQPVPPGHYTGSVESFAGTRMIDSRTLETYARITEVRVEAGLAVLVLETGQKASLGDIGGLRAPVNG
jgi:flagellar basal-body rod modification protein FlgD